MLQFNILECWLHDCLLRNFAIVRTVFIFILKILEKFLFVKIVYYFVFIQNRFLNDEGKLPRLPREEGDWWRARKWAPNPVTANSLGSGKIMLISVNNPSKWQRQSRAQWNSIVVATFTANWSHVTSCLVIIIISSSVVSLPFPARCQRRLTNINC